MMQLYIFPFLSSKQGQRFNCTFLHPHLKMPPLYYPCCSAKSLFAYVHVRACWHGWYRTYATTGPVVGTAVDGKSIGAAAIAAPTDSHFFCRRLCNRKFSF